MAVEFLLLTPLLLLITFGTIEWGHYFVAREVVVNAAREGARAGVLGVPGVDPVAVAKAALDRGGLNSAKATVNTTADGTGACPASYSCMYIQYDVPNLTGYVQPPLVPRYATAVAQMLATP